MPQPGHGDHLQRETSILADIAAMTRCGTPAARRAASASGASAYFPGRASMTLTTVSSFSPPTIILTTASLSSGASLAFAGGLSAFGGGVTV